MQIGTPPSVFPQSYLNATAQMDIVIMGFYEGWTDSNGVVNNFSGFTKQLKALNPNIQIGQYTILQEAYQVPNYNVNITTELTNQNWWLKDASGAGVQDTVGSNTWVVDITNWTTPDANGNRYPQWYANYEYNLYFQNTPNFTIWYADNTFSQPWTATSGDWMLNGATQSNTDPTIMNAYQQGHVAEWKKIRSLSSNLIMANPGMNLSTPNYQGQLDASFMEAITGLSWSVDYGQSGGWALAMNYYQTTLSNLRNPSQWFAVYAANYDSNTLTQMGTATYYSFFRYAYASSLMQNGCFAFSGTTYQSPPIFDEYSLKLGQATSTAQAWINGAWTGNSNWASSGVWSRQFTNGMAMVNSTTAPVTVNVGSGYWHLNGTQDLITNNGASIAESITIPARDGIILKNSAP